MSDWHRNWLLCGGIGSGKSAVRGILESHHVNTIDADSVGHEVISPGGPAADRVGSTWPEVLIDGEIDRSALGRIVFADRDQLRLLEEMTHPFIFAIIQERAGDGRAPVVVEVPILRQPFDPPWHRAVVDSRDDVRLARAIERGAKREDVLKRMANQPARDEWLAAADAVIPNHGDLGDLAVAVGLFVESVLTTPTR